MCNTFSANHLYHTLSRMKIVSHKYDFILKIMQNMISLFSFLKEYDTNDWLRIVKKQSSSKQWQSSSSKKMMFNSEGNPQCSSKAIFKRTIGGSPMTSRNSHDTSQERLTDREKPRRSTDQRKQLAINQNRIAALPLKQLAINQNRLSYHFSPEPIDDVKEINQTKKNTITDLYSNKKQIVVVCSHSLGDVEAPPSGGETALVEVCFQNHLCVEEDIEKRKSGRRLIGEFSTFQNSYIPENPRTPSISYISLTVIPFKKPTSGPSKTFIINIIR
ncbi:hypothetical protein LXL04_037079 [Taraxacum kok-saghyz]